jgi:hypothetical protein
MLSAGHIKHCSNKGSNLILGSALYASLCKREWSTYFTHLESDLTDLVQAMNSYCFNVISTNVIRG